MYTLNEELNKTHVNNQLIQKQIMTNAAFTPCHHRNYDITTRKLFTSLDSVLCFSMATLTTAKRYSGHVVQVRAFRKF